MPEDLLQRVYEKADKIRELPEGVRDRVLDALYEKVMAPTVNKSKGLNADQKDYIKYRFKEKALGIKTAPIPEDRPLESDYKKSGLPTGAGGRFQSGVMSGLANITEIGNKLPGWVPGGVPNKYKRVVSEGIAKERDSAAALKEATAAYTERHPTKSNLAEIAGQSLPGMPYGMVSGMGLPAVGAAASIPARLGANALRGGAAGAVENLAFDPTLSGAAKGGALGAVTSLPFTLGGAMLRRLGKGGAKITGEGAREAVPGIAESGSKKLEEISQAKFQKPLSSLTPSQKTEAVQEWMSQTKKASDTAKAEAAKAAKIKNEEKIAAKTETKVKLAKDRVMSKVEVRRAMDEAKELQKKIAEFIKTNRRAPTDDELTALRATKEEAVPTGEMKAPVPTVPPAKQDVSDFRKLVLAPMLRKQLAEAGTEEEKKILTQQLASAEAPLPEAFKIESPEVIAAVQSVADTSKALGPKMIERIKHPLEGEEVVFGTKIGQIKGIVVSGEGNRITIDDGHGGLWDKAINEITRKVPEGVAGTGGGPEVSALERRAKEALRKSNARQAGVEAHVAEAAQAEVKTPETELLDKEEEFLQRIEVLEGLGAKGKEAAKNLNRFVRNGTIKMDDAFVMIDKVLEEMKKKGVQ